jgi:hypothetical protein
MSADQHLSLTLAAAALLLLSTGMSSLWRNTAFNNTVGAINVALAIEFGLLAAFIWGVK